MTGIGIGIGMAFGRRTPWTLGTASPLLWTRATQGITGGAQGVLAVDVSTWTPTNAAAVAGGSDYEITAAAGVGVHGVAIAPSSSVAGPMEVTVDFEAGTATWLYVQTTTALACYNIAAGTLGTGSGASLLSHAVTSLGGGRFRTVTRVTYTAAATITIGLADADNTTSWNAVGTETVKVRIQPSLSSATLGLVQQRILDWADVRGNGRKWTQSTAALQPFYWTDSRGPLVKFHGAQYMQADTLAAGFGGTSQPWWFVCALDGMVRDGVAKTLMTLGGGAGVLFCATSPNLNATQSRANRRDDGGDDNPIVITTTGKTHGVVVDRYDGVTRSYDVAGVTGSSAQAGVLAITHVTIGAVRYAAGASVGEYMTSAIREAAISPTTISAANAARAASTLKARYGY